MNLEIIVLIMVVVISMVLGYFMGYVDAKNNLLKVVKENYKLRSKES